MARPTDNTGYIYEPGMEPDVSFGPGGIPQIAPPSARQQPRSDLGKRLVDDYASRFSDAKAPAASVKNITSLPDFFDPQKRTGALAEAKQETFNEGKLRALQGGVGLPTYDKPDAPLRAGLPEGVEPWAAEPVKPGVAPVINAPIQQSNDIDYRVRQDIIAKHSPVPPETMYRPGFGSLGGFIGEGEFGLDKLEGLSPEQAEIEWANDAIAKPTPMGTLSTPTFGEQAAMYPFALGAGLTERAFEELGLDSPEPAIPIGGGGIYGYETGKSAPELVTQVPVQVGKAIGRKLGAGWDAAMQTPMTSEDGVLGYLEDMARSTGNAFEAMTGIPGEKLGFKGADYFEMTPERRAEIEAEPGGAERLARVDQQRHDAMVKKVTDFELLPSFDAIGDDIGKITQAVISLPGEVLGRAGDPTLTPEQRAEQIGELGAGLALGAGGSFIETVASPLRKSREEPLVAFFDALLPGQVSARFRARPGLKEPVEVQWLRDDAKAITPERDAVKGEAKVAENALRDVRLLDKQLADSGYYDTPEAKAAIDAKVSLARAEQRLADAEAAVDGARAAKPIVPRVLYEGATKSEQRVPAAQDAVKGEFTRLSVQARKAAEAEAAAAQRVASTQQALTEHMQGRPFGDWSEVRREAFKAKRGKEESAARPSTKFRVKGEPTPKALDRHEKAQTTFKEFAPWFDEYKRLRAERNKAQASAAAARKDARKARQDDGATGPLREAEDRARVGREATREMSSDAKAAMPRVGKLQEAAKAARQAVRDAKVTEAQASAAAYARKPSADAALIGKLGIEKRALAARVRNAGDDLVAADKALRLAKERFEQAQQIERAELTKAMQNKRSAEAGARPPGVRAAAKDRATFEAEAARLQKELDAARAEEAAALKVLAQEQGGNGTAFDVLRGQHNARAAEAMAAGGKDATGLDDLGPTPRGNSAAEWAQMARDGVTEAATRLEEVNAGLDVARKGADEARFAGLPPKFRESVLKLEEDRRSLTSALKDARAQARASGDAMAKQVADQVAAQLAQVEANIGKAESIIRRNESQRGQTVRRTDEGATALRNQMAMRARRQQQIESRLMEERNAARRRFKATAEDFAKASDPLAEAVARDAAAAEALKSWDGTKEPVFKALVTELNRVEDDYAKSESKQFWTDQLFRLAPQHLMTGGASLVWQVAKRLASRWLDEHGRGWLRQAVMSRDARIPAAFSQAISKAEGEAAVRRMALEDAMRRIPREDWPTIGKWMDLEHSLAEGGYWMPGNFDFKGKEAPGHLTKLDPATGQWSLTKAGNVKIWEWVSEANRYPKGSPENVAALNQAQRLIEEMDLSNTYGSALVRAITEVTDEAARQDLPRDADSLRPVYLPQILTEAKAKERRGLTATERDAAGRRKDKVEERAGQFSDGPGTAPAVRGDSTSPILEPDLKEYNSSLLRKTRVPMSERELIHGLDTDLGRRVAAIGRLNYDIQLRSIFNWLADARAKTPEEFKPVESLAKAQDEMRGGGAKATDVNKAWKLIPDDPKYGKLAGKYLPENEWYELMNMELWTKQAASLVNRSMATWKRWQTTGNLTTGMRNYGINAFVYAPAAGISLLNPANWPYYLETVADWLQSWDKRDPLHHELAKSGQLTSAGTKGALMADAAQEFKGALERGGVEPMKAIVQMMYEGPKAVGKLAASPKKALAEKRAMEAWTKEYTNPKLTREQRLEVYARKPQPGVLAGAEKSADTAYKAGGTVLNAVPEAMMDWYGFGDKLFKETWYRKARRNGMSPEAAQAKLPEHFPDYNTIPGFAHVLRGAYSLVGKDGKPIPGLEMLNLAMSKPFFAYNAASIPIFMKWAKENPAQGALWMAFHKAFTGMNLAEAGLTEERAKAIEDAMPSYRRKREKLLARKAPKWAKNAEGEWLTVDEGFTHPMADTVVPWNEDAADSENMLGAARQWLGIGQHPAMSFIEALTGVSLDSADAPPVWKPGDPNIASKMWSHVAKEIAPPWMPSPSSVMEGDLGLGPERPGQEWFGGGKAVRGLARAQGGVPNRDGRIPTMDQWQTSQLGVKTGVASESESARLMSEQVRDQLAQAERDAVASVSRRGFRMNELDDVDPRALTKAQGLVVERVMPKVEDRFRRMWALRDDPVVEQYVQSYAPAIEAWNRYQNVPNLRGQWLQEMEWFKKEGWAPLTFDQWVQDQQQWLLEDAYDALRAATGAGTRETGEARSEMRTGE